MLWFPSQPWFRGLKRSHGSVSLCTGRVRPVGRKRIPERIGIVPPSPDSRDGNRTVEIKPAYFHGDRLRWDPSHNHQPPHGSAAHAAIVRSRRPPLRHFKGRPLLVPSAELFFTCRHQRRSPGNEEPPTPPPPLSSSSASIPGRVSLLPEFLQVGSDLVFNSSTPRPRIAPAMSARRRTLLKVIVLGDSGCGVPSFFVFLFYLLRNFYWIWRLYRVVIVLVLRVLLTRLLAWFSLFDFLICGFISQGG